MMTPRIKPKQTAIDHVRDPGHWMPIRRIRGFAGPNNARPRQAGIDVQVADDVGGIIKADEGIIRYTAITEPGAEAEKETEKERNSIIGVADLPLNARFWFLVRLHAHWIAPKPQISGQKSGK